MFKFENINQLKSDNKEKETEKSENYNEELKETSSLQKIRDHSKIVSPVLKTVALGAAMIGGLEIGKKIDDNNKEKTRLEISQSKTIAEKYLIKENKRDNNKTSEILDNDNFISEVALWDKGAEEIKSLIMSRDFLQSAIKDDIDSKDDLRGFEKQMKENNVEINQAKNQLSIKDKELAKEKIAKMIVLVEEAKNEVIKHISSDEYLNKLAAEMDISKEAAAEHQKVRVSNVKNLSYEFKQRGQIFFDTKGVGYAYYSNSENNIVLPWTENLTDAETKSYFYEAIVHEILHESTQAEDGMSNHSIETLEKSFKTEDKNESKEDREYYSRPEELIVRKQILDLEMEKLGLKKYEEKFTDEHYKKLLILKKDNKLSQDATDFIDHIKPEDFPKVMNDLAELKDNGNTYHHPDWDYNSQDYQA